MRNTIIRNHTDLKLWQFLQVYVEYRYFQFENLFKRVENKKQSPQQPEAHETISAEDLQRLKDELERLNTIRTGELGMEGVTTLYSGVENLLITGNGFDIECGLKSKFNDYFADFVKKGNNSDIIDGFNTAIEILNSSDNSVIVSALSYIWGELDNNSELNCNLTDIKNHIKILREGSSDEFNESLFYIFNAIRKNNFDFWNLYFISNKNDSNSDWCDVEKEMTIFFLGEKVLMSGNAPSWFKTSPRSFLLDGLEALKNNTSRNGSINNNNGSLIFLYLACCNYKSDLYSELKEHLLKFELKLSDYLKLQLYDGDSVKKSYVDNYKRLTKQMFNEEPYNLLSFNYTDINSEDNTIDKQSKSRFIHGKLNSNPIIGIDIDQYNMKEFDNYEYDWKDKTYYFTKQYRVLSDTASQNVDILKRIKKIVFYGHSLSESDYSYFETLFDYFNIYSSYVDITFYYKSFLKDEQTEAISWLFRKYIEHIGKNKLLTKLELENRIHVLDIDN